MQKIASAGFSISSLLGRIRNKFPKTTRHFHFTYYTHIDGNLEKLFNTKPSVFHSNGAKTKIR